MLGSPLPLDRAEGASAADRLIGLVLESGVELFHDPDQYGWASVRIDGHWENHPIRSRPFQGRIISALIDPRSGALRGVPREVRDLVAAARNSWVVCFDNLSHLPEDLAHAACRLATGGGFGGRELYSDHDEAIFDAIRPMVFNAIPDLGAARLDFLDHAVIVEFLDMKPAMRRDEAQFWREFEEVRPRILGALLDVAAAGLRNLPGVVLEQPLRMADFATWISACEMALGLERGEALDAYRANCAEARDLALAASPVYEPLLEVARSGFSGTSSELLLLLSKLASDSARRSRRCPKAPNALSSLLRRMAGSSRSTGIEIYFTRADHQGRRMISVKSASVVPQRSSASSAP